MYTNHARKQTTLPHMYVYEHTSMFHIYITHLQCADVLTEKPQTDNSTDSNEKPGTVSLTNVCTCVYIVCMYSCVCVYMCLLFHSSDN